MPSLVLKLEEMDYDKMSALNKIVDERLVKLQRFLDGYKEDISYHKKHEVVGAIKELVMIRTVLDQLCVVEFE